MAPTDDAAVAWDPWSLTLFGWTYEDGWRILAKWDETAALQISFLDSYPRRDSGLVQLKLIRAYTRPQELRGVSRDELYRTGDIGPDGSSSEDPDRDYSKLPPGKRYANLVLYVAAWTKMVERGSGGGSVAAGTEDRDNPELKDPTDVAKPYLYRIPVGDYFATLSSALHVECAGYEVATMKTGSMDAGGGLGLYERFLNKRLHPECSIEGGGPAFRTIQDMIYASGSIVWA